MTVVTVKGEGGAVWDMDVPDPETSAGERFAAQLESGALTIISEPDEAVVEPEPEPEPEGDLSDLTVPQLTELAAVENIDLGDATKKADVIAAIEEARAG